jgi:DNA-nicking Smr family endonuclease
MKQLSDLDIENMECEFASKDDLRAIRKNATRKIIKDSLPARFSSTDFHGETEEGAWQNILREIYSNTRSKFEMRIVSGRSGVLRERVREWLTDSVLTPFIVEWKLENPGAYIAKIRRPKNLEIIRDQNGKYKVVTRNV